MKEKKIKITFCITSLGKGGAERVICNLSNYFASSLVYSVSILAVNKSKVAYDLDSSIKLFFADDKLSKNKIKSIYNRIHGFRKQINLINPDVIVSFLPTANYLSLANKKNRKVIISVRNDPKYEYATIKDKVLMRLLYPKADGMIFQTDEAREYFKFMKIEKNTIIPNSINLDFLIDRFVGERDKKIVTVGRLEKQKNHAMLIKAYSEFFKKNRNYTLDIYGEGSCREELETLIENLHLEHKVTLHGQVDNIIDCIYKASLFVLSSDYEGMPNALLEAMALGLPVISTDCPCGGPKMLINDCVNGMLVPVNDYSKLSERMLDILSNTESIDKYSQNASKIQKKLSPKRVNEKWREFVEEIIKK